MKKHIIISGGGIAGLTAAKLLSGQGHTVTVLERASAFNKSGFLISLKSFGVKIMDELGLTAQLLRESSPSEMARFVESDDHVIQEVSYEKMSENIERSVLITRGGLHHVLYESIKDDVNILFSTTIDQLHMEGEKVQVMLSDERMLEADLLIVSEGLRSTTREKYFTESRLEDFNVLYMGGRLKGSHPYKVGHFNIYIDVDKMLSIYPIAPDEIAIQCYISHAGELLAVKDLLKGSFEDYHEDVRNLLERFESNGLMFIDKMGMVNSPDLVKGKVVLLGDAGYCPTALSGMGASLSIYGAKALAHFIRQSPEDIAAACRNYDTLMHPIIQKFQGNARKNAASFIPRNEAQYNQFVNAFRSASDDEVRKIMTDPIVLSEDQLEFKI